MMREGMRYRPFGSSDSMTPYLIGADDNEGAILGKLGFLRIQFFLVGFVLLGVWVVLTWDSIDSNLVAAVSHPFEIAAAGPLVLLMTLLLVRGQTKDGKQDAII